MFVEPGPQGCRDSCGWLSPRALRARYVRAKGCCFIAYGALTCLGIYAFVIPKDGVSDSDEAVKEGLLELVKSKIAAFAVPNEILVS